MIGTSQRLTVCLSMTIVGLLTGCMPIVRAPAPTILAIQSHGKPNSSAVMFGMDSGYFERKGVCIIIHSYGSAPDLHQWKFYWQDPFVKVKPYLDFGRELTIEFKAPEESNVFRTCDICLVLEALMELPPLTVNKLSTFRGKATCYTRLISSQIEIDLQNVRLDCVEGQAKSLAVSGIVKAKRR